MKKSGSSLQLSLTPCHTSNNDHWCDLSTGLPRPFVPEQFRRQIFEHLHNISHPDVAATTKLICKQYAWPHMKKTIKLWVQTCEQCQRSMTSAIPRRYWGHLRYLMPVSPNSTLIWCALFHHPTIHLYPHLYPHDDRPLHQVA
ncbi:hypothetical protein JTE90_015458 [Oedothorax gibbosus]|uniref:Integrase zinc-binding domain-containing protein n=1 Tax=Oedothorax gibbosus TaxID=931172 RepID=A0AAV6UAT9_9ARAC|nr:hypothetical protein JTE90_015458 [Oedothorax gibbosus]